MTQAKKRVKGEKVYWVPRSWLTAEAWFKVYPRDLGGFIPVTITPLTPKTKQ